MCKDWIEWTTFSCEDRYMCQPKDNGGPFWAHMHYKSCNGALLAAETKYILNSNANLLVSEILRLETFI
jgi:hypothetical protein